MNLLNLFRRKPVKAARSLSPSSPEMRRILQPGAVNQWMMPSLSTITPTYIEAILRGAFSGSPSQTWELFNLMEDTWPRLAKNLGELKNAVASMQWNLEAWADEGEAPSPEAEEKRKLISAALWSACPDPAMDEGDFEDCIKDLLDAWGKGMSVIEVDWEIRGAGPFPDVTAPRAFIWAHPKNYAWSDSGRLGLVSSGDEYQVDAVSEFPPNKFLIGIAKAKTGHASQSARLRSLAWWWCAANFSSDWLLNLAQVFGLPFRWANYDRDAAQETVDKIASMLENMGSSGWAAFPEGTTLELKEASKAGAATPQGDMLERADRQCDILILGQTLTTDVGDSGSRALGDVHADVRTGNIKAAADWAAKVINRQLIPMLLELNYGNTMEAPEFCVDFNRQEDETANAARDAVLIDKGIAIPKAWFYERHGIPIPQEGEEVIEKAAPPPMPPGFTPGFPPRAEEEQEPDDKEQEDEPEEDEEEAKAQNMVEEAARAVADDLTPVHDRLNRILEIRDAGIMQARMREFLREIEGSLADDMKADPRLAGVLQKIMVKSMEKGLKDE